jgi:hypothetical protein
MGCWGDNLPLNANALQGLSAQSRTKVREAEGRDDEPMEALFC